MFELLEQHNDHTVLSVMQHVLVDTCRLDLPPVVSTDWIYLLTWT